jgi:hypothetical protein
MLLTFTPSPWIVRVTVPGEAEKHLKETALARDFTAKRQLVGHEQFRVNAYAV